MAMSIRNREYLAILFFMGPKLILLPKEGNQMYKGSFLPADANVHVDSLLSSSSINKSLHHVFGILR